MAEGKSKSGIKTFLRIYLIKKLRNFLPQFFNLKISYGVLNAQGMSISHFPQTSAPVFASFSIQISKHFFLSNPSTVNAPEKQFCTHFLQLPFFLYKQRSSVKMLSASTGISATREPYRPQHPFSFHSSSLPASHHMFLSSKADVHTPLNRSRSS